MAQSLLSQQDSTEVQRLVDLYNLPDREAFDWYSTSCVFADEARSRAGEEEGWAQFDMFKKWHFLNLERTAERASSEACNRDCVLHAIEYHKARLADHSLTDRDRAEALIFLGHWVGDVHQPLHISFADDLGGNAINDIRGSYYYNGHLHGVWDSGIISRARGALTFERLVRPIERRRL